MLKSNIQKKLLAIILIFTLTFANFAVVTKAYATSFAETIFGTNSDTGHKNIEFDAYFETEGNKVTSVISDVNNKDLAIKFDLGVRDSGYLKNAKVELLGSDENKLNFEVEKYEENSITAEKEVKKSVEKIEVENTSENVIEENLIEETENNEITEITEINSKDSENVISENDISKINEEDNSEITINDETNSVTNEISEEVENSVANENVSSDENEVIKDEEINTTSEETETEEEIIENIFNSEYVQNFEDNVLTFVQINSTSDVSIDLPIRYKNEAYVSNDEISNDVTVRFSGIYVDSQGKEIAVEKEEVLTVSWKDERDINVESGVTKYIDFGAGVILQTIVRVDSSKNGNRLPIKSTTIEAKAPILAGIAPNNVVVVANSLEGTNGENAGNLTFNENNWSYNNEENKVLINVENNSKVVKESEYSEEFLKDGEKEKEGYYNANGVDEYLITYTYSNISIDNIEEITDSEIKINVLNIADGLFLNENSYRYELGTNKGEIVSFNKVNETVEISKAYEYINYSNNNKYEIELANDAVINVSYKDIIKDLKLEDVSNKYIDKEGNEIETDDTYYKRIEISKENFDKMLGDAGEIKVLDEQGNEIGIINNFTVANEEGNIVLNIEGRYSKLNYEITKPIAEGNIVIRNIKVLSDLSIDKSGLINMAKIASKTKLKADYEYVEETVEVEEKEIETELKDTSSRANIILDRESLSTLSLNENVEIRIDLNNARLESDIYGHSVFEIELPEYIESLEITNTKMLYGEGLEITDIVAEGRIIRITVDGVQKEINTGELNSTNIVMNANIKVNLYTPAKKEQVKLRYTNDEATSYENNGEDAYEVSYSAPTGLVAVNSIEGYNNEAKIQSVRQGKKTDLIDIYAERKEATQEIIVMNNNVNEISNVKILGRFPFKGAQDILTGDNLGTTLDARILSGITGDERNRGNFKIYYSENGEATEELENSENGWQEEVESLENIKSYLIVPEDGYVMEDTEVLRFTYRFEIPENLNHNESIFGTFMVSYKNNSEIMVTDEKEAPDLVGLTTGEGPELNIELLSNKEKIREYEELEVTIKGKNVGDNKAKNVVASFPIPDEMQYLSEESASDKLSVSLEDNVLVAKVPELQASEEFEYKVNLMANRIDKGVHTIAENNQFSAEVQPKLNLEADDLGAVLEAVGNVTTIENAKITLSENIRNIEKDTFTSNEKFTMSIKVSNIIDDDINNIVVTQYIPEELSFENSYITKYDVSKQRDVRAGEGTYNESSRTITYNIDKLSKDESIYLNYTVKVNELNENNINSNINLGAIAKINNDEIYEAKEFTIKLAIPSVSAIQTSNITDTYIKDGSTIDYIFTIKNEGNYAVEDFNFTDVMPEGMIVQNVKAKFGDEEERDRVFSNNESVITGTLNAGQTAIITVTAKASYLEGSKEKSILNSATISGKNIQTIKTNAINNIIESSLDTSRVGAIDDSEDTSSDSELSSVQNNITKTYRIDGLAWEDTNKDGMRNEGEKLLNGIIVTLVNNETGVKVKTVSTTFDGTYSFTNVPNGNYFVLFEYDTVKYAVTTYHKDNVGANINSDVIAKPIEIDGKTKNVAITDVIAINNGSMSGIDIGLMLADSFDLQLEKTVSKITVQTSKGTTTNNFDDSKLGKVEIASKYVSGSTVLVEYNIKVTNVGDISGYAKKIVDYIPEGMKLNTSIQSNAENWYTGSDGNLYSTALANTELKKGESRTIKLVLTKEMTEDNTGIVNNLAEIYEDYNIYGVSDRNSVPANKAQGENDLGSADSVILIKTGETLIYISVIITTILIGTIAVLTVVQKKKSLKNMEGGV